MRMCFFITHYYPIVGGITTYTDDLHKNMLKKGNTVVIIANVGGGNSLTKAFAIVERPYPRGKLLIVRYGNYRKGLEALSNGKNPRKKVIFTDFVENTFLLLSVTDMYIHVPIREDFSISILEAISAGKLAVALNVGGIPDVVTSGTTDVIVDSVPEKIASEIVDLFSDKERMKTLGEKAKIHGEKNFTWSKIADEFLWICNRGG